MNKHSKSPYDKIRNAARKFTDFMSIGKDNSAEAHLLFVEVKSKSQKFCDGTYHLENEHRGGVEEMSLEKYDESTTGSKHEEERELKNVACNGRGNLLCKLRLVSGIQWRLSVVGTEHVPGTVAEGVH
ncbi:hypothetical protein CEXT_532301 [Caerostris extrusa]|uniref:Uncharacterized protein n=1 Tax=Caerostris extrusa TaxID=172846 RepID=A0AAV4SQQ7_CAEEX|nr:hypothetical protein CEXT_532301 [Caerostris extrusa]